jgi:hypothetical protein
MVTRDQLLEVIRIGSESGATEPQRQLAAQACLTLGTALGAQLGQPLGAAPGANTAPIGARPNISSVIDLINAQLRAFLDRQQAAAGAAAPTPTSEPTHAPTPAESR